ncbi:MAG: hypothetical protein FWC17_06955 [Treponema sp.]|nr:hypothetical protein [Treponema sp.]MCL2267488.1 hypothetical protein [Treponema sp.]
MAFSEKSAIAGGESSNQKIASGLVKSGGMETNEYTFSDIVDKACEGLMNRQIKFSIRRIKVMEERLNELEQELDAFLESRV